MVSKGDDPTREETTPQSSHDATTLTGPVPKDDAEARRWFDTLMRAHGARLGRFFAYKVRDEDVARELVIETFFRAWKSRRSFRGDAKPTTWLWTIAQRALAHHFKKQARRADEVLVDAPPEASADARHELVDRASQRDALLACLSGLNERIQKTVELVWILGHSYVEAAELLGDTPDTVRMRLKRARKPLQDCLAQKGIVGAG